MNGCRKLIECNYWHFCGEREQGLVSPLCVNCGGKFKLKTSEDANQLPANLQGNDMKLTKEQKKEFEDFIGNPYMLSTRNEPGFYEEYDHPWTCGAFEAYKKWKVEPQQTRVVSEKQHEDGVVQMISAFLQRMKSHHAMIVRTDDNDKLIIINQLTGSWYHLHELQDAGLI